MQQILSDSGILLSCYQADEPLHKAVVSWRDRTMAALVISPICRATLPTSAWWCSRNG